MLICLEIIDQGRRTTKQSHDSLVVPFKTASIKNYIQNYQTVTAINASRAVPITSNLRAFL